MADNVVDFRFEGIDEMESALLELGASLSRQVLQETLKKAAEPVAAEARVLAPRSDEYKKYKKHLADSVVVRTTLPKNQRRLRFRAGTEKNFAEVFIYNTAPHAHLVEFGHRLVRGVTRKGTILEHKVVRAEGEGERRWGRGRYLAHLIKRANDAKYGREIGHVAAHPFMRPAWDAKRELAYQILKDELWNVLLKKARQLRSRTERNFSALSASAAAVNQTTDGDED